jgi:restriction endonuclease S subunit
LRDRNENKPGYKKAKIGWIPEEWNAVFFRDCCRIAEGQVDPTDEQYSEFIHIGPENIESNSGRIFGTKTAKELGLKSGKYLFNNDAIVYSKIRPNLNKVCIPSYNGLCSADCYPIWTLDGNNKEYLYYFILSSFFLRQSIPVSLRTGMPKINRVDLNLLYIILPPIPEQKRIAEILSTWDKAIEQTRKLIDAKKRLKKGLMQQLLMGEKRLQEFKQSKRRIEYKFFDLPDDWECPHIRKIAEECSERNTNQDDLTVLACSKYLGFVESSEYFGKRVFSEDTSNYKIVRRGCFGFPANHIEEGSIGLLTSHDMGLVSPIYIVFKFNDKIIPKYIYAVFKTETFRHIFAISTNASVDRRGSLRWKEFSLIRVPLPSLKEQKRIVDILQSSEDEIKKLEARLIALEKQKRGLMQRLLTGEIRVKT